MKAYLVCILTTLAISQIFSEEHEKTKFRIRLDELSYQEKTISTSTGGIIEADGFYLQAKQITYQKDLSKNIHNVEASGNLMLSYHGQIFLANHLEYDFITKEGILKAGRTQVNLWYLKGGTIYLHKDKSYDIKEVSITTSEMPNSEWEMTSKKVHLSPDQTLISKDIKVKAFKIPIFWIPGYQTNLKTFGKSPVSYVLTWVSGQGPKIGMAYNLYSGKNFTTNFRIEYLWGRGPSAAFEAFVNSDNKNLSFTSQNFAAHDTFYRDTDPNKRKKRFRLQGKFIANANSNRAYVKAVYDRLSDKNLPTDFPSQNFEFNELKTTHVESYYWHNMFTLGCFANPRINSFDSFNQKLPEFFLNIKPFYIPKTPILIDNEFKLAFYDYVYTNLLDSAPNIFQRALRDFHSLKAYTKQSLIAPMHYKGLSFVPKGGFIGSIYSDSPRNKSAYQGVFHYGAKTHFSLEKNYQRGLHKVIPYIEYTGLSKPSAKDNLVYIFDLSDGFHRLNMARVGIDQLVYLKNSTSLLPNINFDLYTLGFFGDQTYQKTFPKAGFESKFENTFSSFKTQFQWNFNNSALDLLNANLGVTLSPNVAFHLEYRHRSKYYFRKANLENYVIETARSLDELLRSPLSDGRNTLLSKLEFKLTPITTLCLQTQSGWGRRGQKSYNEAKLDLYTIISSSWRLRLSYEKNTRATVVTCGINLIRH